jgi:hypothetical protein
MDIAGQAVELCDDQHGAALPAFRKSHSELRSVRVVLAALHLDKLRCELAVWVATAGAGGDGTVMGLSELGVLEHHTRSDGPFRQIRIAFLFS